MCVCMPMRVCAWVRVCVAIVNRPVFPLYLEDGRCTNFLNYYYFYFYYMGAVEISFIIMIIIKLVR